VDEILDWKSHRLSGLIMLLGIAIIVVGRIILIMFLIVIYWMYDEVIRLALEKMTNHKQN